MPKLERRNSKAQGNNPYLHQNYKTNPINPNTHQQMGDPCQYDGQNKNMQAHLIDIKDSIEKTLCKVQQQRSIARYMIHIKTWTRCNSEEFTTWLSSMDSVSKLRGHDHKELCFSKHSGNLLKILYSLLLYKFSWYALKEKICRKNSQKQLQPAMLV